MKNCIFFVPKESTRGERWLSMTFVSEQTFSPMYTCDVWHQFTSKHSQQIKLLNLFESSDCYLILFDSVRRLTRRSIINYFCRSEGTEVSIKPSCIIKTLWRFQALKRYVSRTNWHTFTFMLPDNIEPNLIEMNEAFGWWKMWCFVHMIIDFYAAVEENNLNANVLNLCILQLNLCIAVDAILWSHKQLIC